MILSKHSKTYSGDLESRHGENVGNFDQRVARFVISILFPGLVICCSSRLIFKPKADLNGDLEFLDFVFFNQPAHFRLHGVVTDKPSLSQRCRRFQFSCRFVPWGFLLRVLFSSLSRGDALFCDNLLPRLPYLEQLIEEGAVIHNRFAQLLGVRRALLIAHSDGLRRSVICHNVRMID